MKPVLRIVKWFFLILFVVMAAASVVSMVSGDPDAVYTLILPVICIALILMLSRKQKPASTHTSYVSSHQKQPQRQEDPEKQEREARRLAAIDQKKQLFAGDLASIPRVEIPLSTGKVSRRRVSDLPEYTHSSISKRTVLDNIFPFVVIDTETTGLRPAGNDIIEVSAIRFEKGFVPVSCFTTLLRPREPIPEEASRVNHITDDMVQDKPAFSEVAEALSAYISKCNIVGHNLEFDLKFLFVCGADLPEKKRYFDTLALAKQTLTCPRSTVWDEVEERRVSVDYWDVEDYKLTTLCDYYKIYRDDAHRSLSDCYATALLFKNLIEDKINKP